MRNPRVTNPDERQRLVLARLAAVERNARYVAEAAAQGGATPLAKMYRATDGAPGSGVTYEQFDRVEYDTDNMADPSSSANNLTVRTPGYYSFGAGYVVTGGTGVRQLSIVFNGYDSAGNTIARTVQPGFPGGNEMTVVSPPRWCNAGDFAAVLFYQDSGGVLTAKRDHGGIYLAGWRVAA